MDWAKGTSPILMPLARVLNVRKGAYRRLIGGSADASLKILGVIRDAKGAVIQKLSPSVAILPPAPGVVAGGVVGRTEPAGLDVNGDKALNVRDVIASALAAPPDTPA